MSVLVDTPFAVHSHQVGLIQIADLYAGLFSLYSELLDNDSKEDYEGQLAHVQEWVELLASRFLGRLTDPSTPT